MSSGGGQCFYCHRYPCQCDREAARRLLEQFPGGPVIDLPVERKPLTETCAICGKPAPDGFGITGYAALCRVCSWQYPYNTNDNLTLLRGMQIGGTGI